MELNHSVPCSFIPSRKKALDVKSQIIDQVSDGWMAKVSLLSLGVCLKIFPLHSVVSRVLWIDIQIMTV